MTTAAPATGWRGRPVPVAMTEEKLASLWTTRAGWTFLRRAQGF